MDASVRPATAADLDDICGIEAAAFEPSRRSSRRSLARAMASPFQLMLVLVMEREVAGFVIVWPFPRTWRIYNLATHPAWRNRGVAGGLLRAVEGRARAAHARWLVLESRPGGDLERYYAQRGFQARRCLHDYYAPGEDAVRMVLSLSPIPSERLSEEP
jgi:ribosomal protein S18 acetylase RimI-like enzyme